MTVAEVKGDREEEEELIKVGFKYYQFYQEGGTYLIGVYYQKLYQVSISFLTFF